MAGTPDVDVWFHVAWSEDGVSMVVEPPGREAWTAAFPWSRVSRVCFKAEDPGMSDGIYVFTTLRPESFVVPMDASGGLELWNEIVRRGLFSPELAIEAASASEGLFCWPPIEPD